MQAAGPARRHIMHSRFQSRHHHDRADVSSRALEDRVHYHDGGHYLWTGGAILHPFIIKMLEVKGSVAIGVAFGTASHDRDVQARRLEMGK